LFSFISSFRPFYKKKLALVLKGGNTSTSNGTNGSAEFRQLFIAIQILFLPSLFPVFFLYVVSGGDSIAKLSS
jgi:hypothetical protein